MGLRLLHSGAAREAFAVLFSPGCSEPQVGRAGEEALGEEAEPRHCPPV